MVCCGRKQKSGEHQPLENDGVLFGLLRQKRKELADRQNVPPYVIFSDRTLVEMSAYFPQTPAALKNIYGVGDVKLQRYGRKFLDVILSYCQAHGIPEKTRSDSEPSARNQLERSDPKDNPKGTRTFLVAGEYNQGKTISALCEEFDVKPTTILGHLTRFALAGNPLRKGADLDGMASTSPELQAAVMSAFDEMGVTALRPVFEALNGEVDYDDLRWIRLMYLVSHHSPWAPGE